MIFNIMVPFAQVLIFSFHIVEKRQLFFQKFDLFFTKNTVLFLDSDISHSSEKNRDNRNGQRQKEHGIKIKLQLIVT